MSFQMLASDASRMRGTLNELGLALGEAKRQREVEKVNNMAVPRDVAHEFQEQQRVLVEQRRVLEQLRQERQLAEGEQFWIHRENRNRWEGWDGDGTDVPAVKPSVFAEAHARLRADPGELKVSADAIPPQDGYLLAEFTGVIGFTMQQLEDCHYRVAVCDRQGRAFAHATSDGPLEPDGNPAARKVQVTIPALQFGAELFVEVAIRSYNGSAVGKVPMKSVGQERVPPQPVQVAPEGAWTGGSEKLYVEVALCAVMPHDNLGRGLAHTRVVDSASYAPRSAFPGGELPPSQAHLRQRALEWSMQGQPDIHHVLAEREEAQMSAVWGEGAGGRPEEASPPRPQGLHFLGAPAVIDEPEANPEPENGAAPAFAAFAGWEERSAPRPQAASRAQRDDRGPDREGVGGGGAGLQARPYAASAGFATRDIPEPEAEEADRVPFAAFAGYGDGEPETDRRPAGGGVRIGPMSTAGIWQRRTGTNSGPPSGAERLQLRPASSTEPLQQLFLELKGAEQRGRLGQPDAAQDVLEFAARAAHPNVLEEEGHGMDQLSSYAAILLDAMEKYPSSAILALWMVEALLAIYAAVHEHRHQFAIPLFAAFASAALRFVQEPDTNLHNRLLAGLAAVATPDCRIDTRGLVDYVCQQLQTRRGRLPPITAEHALAVLSVLHSTYRIADQIRHALLVLRAYKSDAHLVIRALVTVGELYELLAEDLSRMRAGEDNAAFEYGVPKQGFDVRLVTTVLDLYPTHRKIGGAGLRAYAAMCRLTPAHLRSVLVDDVRGLASAQRNHESSRSVAVHIAEVVCFATKSQPEAINETTVQLVAKVLCSFARDPGAATNAAQALQRAAATEDHIFSVVDSVPANQLIALAEVHRKDADVMVPLCDLIGAYAGAGRDLRDELVQAGALAVPFRAIGTSPENPRTAAAGARAVKRLICGSREAPLQAARLRGAVLLFNLLAAHGRDAEVVHEVMAALAVVCQEPESRFQLLDPGEPETWSVIDALLRVAETTAAYDPDILVQTCCALGVLTASDVPATQAGLRERIDRGALRFVFDRVQGACPNFRGGREYCERLISEAETSDLSPMRLLDKQGAEVQQLRPRLGIAQATVAEDEAQDSRARRRAYEAKARVKKQGANGIDIFASLRGLGVGAAAPARPEGRNIGEEMEEDAPVQGAAVEPEGGAQSSGIFGMLFSGQAGVGRVEQLAEMASDSESEYVAPKRSSTGGAANRSSTRKSQVKAAARGAGDFI